MKLHTTFTAATSADSRTWVLLHGFLGSSADWAPVCAQQACRGKILTIDLPAHGHSPALATEYTTFESVVELLADTIRSAVQEPVAAVGYSLGGRLLMGVAARYPHMFRSLTLIAAFPGYRSDAERAERAATDNKWSQLLRERPADEFLARWYEQSIFASDYWSADFRAAIFGARAETLRQANELAHMLGVTSASTMPSYWEFLRSTSLPLTYLAGERDPRYCRLAEEIQASNPHSTTHIIAGAGHALLAERAGEVARVIFGSH